MQEEAPSGWVATSTRNRSRNGRLAPECVEAFQNANELARALLFAIQAAPHPQTLGSMTREELSPDRCNDGPRPAGSLLVLPHAMNLTTNMRGAGTRRVCDTVVARAFHPCSTYFWLPLPRLSIGKIPPPSSSRAFPRAPFGAKAAADGTARQSRAANARESPDARRARPSR